MNDIRIDHAHNLDHVDNICTVQCMCSRWKLNTHLTGQILCMIDMKPRTPASDACPHKIDVYEVLEET